MTVNLTRLRAQGFAVAALVFIVDQTVKWLISGPLHLQKLHAVHVANGWPSSKPDISLAPFFGLTWTENYGVSLGMFTAASTEMRLALIGVTGLIALGVAVWMLREKAKGDVLALALVLGGALGNIWDRMTYGFVIDYADLHIGEWRPFLIFNIADAAITAGVLILLARSLLSREKPANNGSNDTGSDTATETIDA